MIDSLAVKPIHPKNGDKYRTKEGIIKEFRFGSWVKISGNKMLQNEWEVIK